MRWWPWLAGEQVRRVAATLGARLGPDWTAQSLVQFAARCGWTPPEQPHAPLGYLKRLLDDVLTRDDVEPPHPSRARQEASRRAARDRAELQRAAQAERRAEMDARDAAAAAQRAGAGDGRQAARAALRQTATARDAADRERATRLADVEARTLAAAAQLVDEVEAWPPVAQPGGGLPGFPARQ
jgi:hypothetical protein